MKHNKVWLLLFSMTIFLAGCMATEAQLDAHATRVATLVTTEVVATLTAPDSGTKFGADIGLSPVEVYRRVAPSVAFIETVTSTGSGILIQDAEQNKYVLTNAHIIWPYAQSRIVFPSGEEFLDVPRIAHDMIGDLALLGPIETDIEPLLPANGEELPVGTSVYLVGYPGEPEIFPQPALAQGIISRLRQWPEEAISYFQVDAFITGGQSGGALISPAGELIGMSGFIFADTFALVASTADLRPRLNDLLVAGNVDGLGNRELPLEGVGSSYRYTPENVWANQLLIFDLPAGSEVEIEGISTQDIVLSLTNNFGEIIESVDDTERGSEELNAYLEMAGPQYVVVEHYGVERSVRITANHPFAVFNDPDDEKRLEVDGVQNGLIDFPGDSDLYYLPLQAGERVEVRVNSTMIDPFITIIKPDQETAILSDDDSGGGLFGLNAFFSYEAKDSGEHLILVADSAGQDVGGYRVEVATFAE